MCIKKNYSENQKRSLVRKFKIKRNSLSLVKIRKKSIIFPVGNFLGIFGWRRLGYRLNWSCSVLFTSDVGGFPFALEEACKKQSFRTCWR